MGQGDKQGTVHGTVRATVHGTVQGPAHGTVQGSVHGTVPGPAQGTVQRVVVRGSVIQGYGGELEARSSVITSSQVLVIYSAVFSFQKQKLVKYWLE